jgi:hypothetical protein
MEYAGRLVVEDQNGARLQMYEYRGRRLFKAVRHYRLETGQPVNRIDFDNYVIAGIGTPLKRVS